ncbi:carboxypeptidase-like regulatory domain-containing protein [Pleomorphovibrio marinus]|uniref:carboxypeptidase-like regulatory domain-containing protein n=1 Tax=Pleomorphovibrio marinus TaxID=2164132 RepID=UPI000E0CB597|nr:carboxypeptidase-like regulatory domain-containing protein [Pleomorphovibrio marinus]
MKNFICAFLLILAYSCKAPKEQSEGIKGNVYWTEGNQMPRIADEETGMAAPTSKLGVQRTILIHELTHVDQVEVGDFLIGTIHTELVETIQTDKNGEYAVKLPPGRYSLFTVESDGHFANTFDRNNYINPVEVKSGEWSVFDILVDYMAAY